MYQDCTGNQAKIQDFEPYIWALKCFGYSIWA
jgi:hypothetical protein